MRPEFAKLCESTRDSVKFEIFSDVYQGRIWKEFLKVNGVNFLCASFCYAFILNIDCTGNLRTG